MTHTRASGRFAGLLAIATLLACEAGRGQQAPAAKSAPDSAARATDAVAAFDHPQSDVGVVADSAAGALALVHAAAAAVPPAHVVAAPWRAGDASVRAKAPPLIRGIYLNAYAAGSRNRLAQLLALADRSEINTFVVDVKDEKGIHYESRIELAREMAQPGEMTIRNLSAFVDTLHAHGLHAIARIVVFKDPILSKAKPDWSVRRPDGGLWVDRAGNTWVSPWEPAVWDYNIEIAREAVEAGFDEVQFDYVRFPEAYASLPPQVHPKEAGTKTDAIVTFLDRARDRIHPLGGIVAADVFGLSPNDPKDVNIGQQWERIMSVADHVLPMVYPSHYLRTHLRNVPQPNRMPYETVFTSMGIGVLRTRKLQEAGIVPARVIPWLQAFSAPWVDREYTYGPEQAAAQMRGVYDTGLEDWIFWHPGSRYEQVADAFASELASRAVEFEPSPSILEQAEQVERTGARAAREQLAARAAPDR